MTLRNTSSHYGWLAKLLHWGMALGIISMLALGWYMDAVATGLQKIQLFGIHKSIGIVLLVLFVIRLLWKWLNPAVPIEDTIPSWQKIAAKISHVLLYILMLLMPVSGWLMSSAYGFPVSVFGLVTLPDLIAPDVNLQQLFVSIHNNGVTAFYILLPIHIGAALLHHFYYRDNTLRKMLPLSDV